MTAEDIRGAIVSEHGLRSADVEVQEVWKPSPCVVVWLPFFLDLGEVGAIRMQLDLIKPVSVDGSTRRRHWIGEECVGQAVHAAYRLGGSAAAYAVLDQHAAALVGSGP